MNLNIKKKNKKFETTKSGIMRNALISALAICMAAMNFFPSFAVEQENSSIPSFQHLAYKESGNSGGYGSGNYLYSPLILTGTGMPEEQIFNVSELERIYNEKKLEVALEEKVYINGSEKNVNGINFVKFMKLCGISNDAAGDTVFRFYTDGNNAPMLTMTWKELKDSKATPIIAFAADGLPLVYDVDSQGYSKEIANNGGPLIFTAGENKQVSGLEKIVISTDENENDPRYELHEGSVLQYMEASEFTVNYIDKNEYNIDDSENSQAVPFKTKVFTMADIEKMIVENEDKASGNYFGISGNEESKVSTGLGGFSDYFAGIDMSWFLREKAGLKNTAGYAVFFGRDNDQFATVKDLSYFFPKADDYSQYYLEEDNETSVHGVIPILAVSKNGYPLLPEHDHELEGCVDYNTFNDNAVAKGFESKIGIVQNVSGPFVAGLANLDGVYGGYRCETSGDCIRIDLYVEKSAYNDGDAGSESTGNNGSADNQGDSNGSGDHQLVTGFPDVEQDSWYEEYVKTLASEGIINGDEKGLFNPQKNVTRAEFVKTIACAVDADVNVDEGSTIYKDVERGSWYEKYVCWAESNGIVKGVSDTEFAPDKTVTRQEMAVIIDRYLESSGKSFVSQEENVKYADDGDVATYAKTHVYNLQKYGIMNGSTANQFLPESSATRAEMAKVICKFAEMVRL